MKTKVAVMVVLMVVVVMSFVQGIQISNLESSLEETSAGEALSNADDMSSHHSSSGSSNTPSMVGGC